MPSGVYVRTEEGKRNLSKSHLGKIPWIKGKHHSEETKQKISSKNINKIPWNKGKINHLSKETILKMSLAKKGTFRSKEVRKILSNAFKGRKLSKETREKIGIGNKGKLKGHKISKEHKYKISKYRTGKHLSNEAKIKLSIARIGSKNGMWIGGVSFEPYTTEWTETLRRSIRERDNYTCQICGKEPSVHVHHIDYDKNNCNPNNLVTLCHGCHSKTNVNREYWKSILLNQCRNRIVVDCTSFVNSIRKNT